MAGTPFPRHRQCGLVVGGRCVNLSPFHQCAVSLVENGYRPISIPKGQKGVTTEGWQHTRATVDDVLRWREGNIGVLTEDTPAVDLDILDETVAAQMQAFVEDLLGEAPIRIGRAPKRMLVCRTSTPFRKVTSRFWISPDGGMHRVEILGAGQQFVAFGIHPDTQRAYRWIGEDIRTIPADDLPLIDEAAARAIADEFDRVAEAAGWQPKGRASGGASSDPFDFLRPKPDISDDEVEALIEAFENPERDYDLWVKLGMALHHQYDGDARGLDVWHVWSSRSSMYDAAATDKKWKSFGDYTGRKATLAFVIAETGDTLSKLRAEKVVEAWDEFKARIDNCDDVDTLVGVIAPEVRKTEMPNHRREMLLRHAQKRATKVAGVTIPLSEFKPSKAAQKAEVTPEGLAAEMQLELDIARHVLDDQFEGGRFIKRFSKMWWTYRDGVWKRAEDDAIARLTMNSLVELTQNEDPRVSKLFERMAESRGDRLNALVTTVVSVMEKACAEEGGDDPLNLNADYAPLVVNTGSAELWFTQDGEMTVKEHCAEHRLTSQVACHFDPDATCPTWDMAVRKVFRAAEDPEGMVRHFEELMGYIMQPTRHQAIWVMLKGPGGNGKSFLLSVMTSLIGSNAVAAHSIASVGKQSSHFTDGLQGKSMLLDDDLKAGTLLPDDWLKKLSEAKSVSADPKYGRSYTFTARCVPVILTNQWPSTSDLSEGLRRRAMVIESNHVLTDEEKNPAHMLTIKDDELPGVLNRMVAGLQRFLRRGHRFDVPAECEASKSRWLDSSNPTSRFASEVIQRTERGGVKCSVVYDAYLNWARYSEHNIRPLGRTKFYESMEQFGYPRVNRKGIHWFRKIEMRYVEGLEMFFDDGGL